MYAFCGLVAVWAISLLQLPFNFSVMLLLLLVLTAKYSCAQVNGYMLHFILLILQPKKLLVDFFHFLGEAFFGEFCDHNLSFCLLWVVQRFKLFNWVFSFCSICFGGRSWWGISSF
jgi:hypothetical protein